MSGLWVWVIGNKKAAGSKFEWRMCGLGRSMPTIPESLKVLGTATKHVLIAEATDDPAKGKV